MRKLRLAQGYLAGGRAVLSVRRVDGQALLDVHRRLEAADEPVGVRRRERDGARQVHVEICADGIAHPRLGVVRTRQICSERNGVYIEDHVADRIVLPRAQVHSSAESQVAAAGDREVLRRLEHAAAADRSAVKLELRVGGAGHEVGQHRAGAEHERRPVRENATPRDWMVLGCLEVHLAAREGHFGIVGERQHSGVERLERSAGHRERSALHDDLRLHVAGLHVEEPDVPGVRRLPSVLHAYRAAAAVCRLDLKQLPAVHGQSAASGMDIDVVRAEHRACPYLYLCIVMDVLDVKRDYFGTSQN